MDQYGYVLKKKIAAEGIGKRYHKLDLELMTVFQLREICRKEKIIQGILDPMDKEELVQVISRYRGAEEHFLIRKQREDGQKAVERVFREVEFREKQDLALSCASRIVVYDGLAIGFYDRLVLPYEKSLAGTNAFVISGDGTVCAVLNLVCMGNGTDRLYLVKEAGIVCRESGVKNYSLYCMGKRESELLYRIYQGTYDLLPRYLEGYQVPLVDFEVREPVPLSMPMAIDFGSSNTTAGVYLDSRYFEKAGLIDGERGIRMNEANYALFYDPSQDWKETPLLPSVVGIRDLEDEEPGLLFGYDAAGLADASYLEEGFCVFYDIKRWMGDPDRKEEITDRQGRRRFVSRKEILRFFFEYVIMEIRNRFKCQVEYVHISCPVKQKACFSRMFAELLPEYQVEVREIIDEGVSVLYNTISDLVQRGKAEEGEEYRALVIDCGGGTTDLSSCRFRVWDKKAAYRIEIDTCYENGEAEFGGNNLTYRILQLLKLGLVEKVWESSLWKVQDLLSGFDRDVYRYVDQNGTGELYRKWEEQYRKAEEYLPTRFKEYEGRGRREYYQVKNNFYFLFGLAERVKKEFYSQKGTLRVVIASEEVRENGTVWMPVDKWRISGRWGKEFRVLKEFPCVNVGMYEVEKLLQGEIYGVLRRFLEGMYEKDELEEYDIIRLTGQSCRIGIFREALKEFVAGKVIRMGSQEGRINGKKKTKEERSSGREERITGDVGLKLTCVEGALKYLKDKRYGFAEVVVSTEEPAVPYDVSAYTHTGEEVVLIHGLRRGGKSGTVSRNMEDLMLKLYLKDLEGEEIYQYSCESVLSDFAEKDYEEIHKKYGKHILQEDTDDICENEVRFFVWSEPEEWSFYVVGVYRKERRLYLGKGERYYLENGGWMRSFFDGMK